MSYRSFKDRDGQVWEVSDRSSSEWEFRPVRGSLQPSRRVRAPGYEKDPFELSAEELQRLLDSVPVPGGRTRKSPFGD